jgi:hypothetical protein
MPTVMKSVEVSARGQLTAPKTATLVVPPHLLSWGQAISICLRARLRYVILCEWPTMSRG